MGNDKLNRSALSSLTAAGSRQKTVFRFLSAIFHLPFAIYKMGNGKGEL